MSRYKTPNEIDVKSLLGVLFDGMKIKSSEDLDVSATGGYLGLYVDDEGNPVTACVCDMAFAAYSACSLTMLPPPVAQSSVDSGTLEENMVDNLGEVFNILSRLFMTNETDHLKYEVAHDSQSIPAEIAELFNDSSKSATFEISIPRYGDGKLSMLVA